MIKIKSILRDKIAENTFFTQKTFFRLDKKENSLYNTMALKN